LLWKGPMKFINRNKELKQLERLSDAERGGMAVLWGRRRVGKTRLLLEWSHRCNGLYLACDESAPAIQRKYFAERIAERFAGFSQGADAPGACEQTRRRQGAGLEELSSSHVRLSSTVVCLLGRERTAHRSTPTTL